MEGLEDNPILAVLDRLPISAVVTDLETGVIVWSNAVNVGMVGARDRSQIVGGNLLDFLGPEQMGVALRDIEAVARGESPPPVVYRLKRLDSGTADVRIASVPIVLGEKRLMLSLATDVTETETARRALSESEQRYRAIVETSPDGIAVVIDGDVAYANPTLLRALGVARLDEVSGESIHHFIAEADRAGVREALSAVLATGAPAPATRVTLVRRGGSTLEVTAQSALISWQGRPATQTLIRDIAAEGIE